MHDFCLTPLGRNNKPSRHEVAVPRTGVRVGVGGGVCVCGAGGGLYVGPMLYHTLSEDGRSISGPPPHPLYSEWVALGAEHYECCPLTSNTESTFTSGGAEQSAHKVTAKLWLTLTLSISQCCFCVDVECLSFFQYGVSPVYSMQV